MDDDAVEWRWEWEQAFLGLARDTSDEEFAWGGLAALAIDPTVRITVLPRDPSAQPVSVENPETVIPKMITLPGGGGQFPFHGTVYVTSSGYVGYTAGDGVRWQSFDAVLWHGGVDVFLGTHGSRTWEIRPGSPRRVIYLRRCVGWAWAAFDLQRHMVERYGVVGPYRVILGIADTAGATLGTVGADWAEPGSADDWGLPMAVEPHVLLLEDLVHWPDEHGVEELALRFGARVVWRSEAPASGTWTAPGWRRGSSSPDGDSVRGAPLTAEAIGEGVHQLGDRGHGAVPGCRRGGGGEPGVHRHRGRGLRCVVPNREFLIGDTPVLVMRKGRAGISFLDGVGVGNADEIVMPLTPHHAAVFGQGGESRAATDDEVNRYNVLQIKNAHQYVHLRLGSDLAEFVRSELGAKAA